MHIDRKQPLLEMCIKEFRVVMIDLEARTIKKYGLNAKQWFKGNK